MKNPCPLCFSDTTDLYHKSKDKDFFRCCNCDLIFVDRTKLLSNNQEKNRYELHQNQIVDKGYKDFLYQVVNPLKERLPLGSIGLDYGSGPFPALQKLLQDESYSMQIFDPFFYNNREVLSKTYDFITLTEVAEHFFNPFFEFQNLVSMLKPEAYLFVLTHRTDKISDFANWYYPNDPTHVCFYSEKTMQYIAAKHQLQLEVLSDRLVIFQKQK